MSERQLQQTLNDTTDFLARQRLLKELWKQCQEREVEASGRKAAVERPTSTRGAARSRGEELLA